MLASRIRQQLLWAVQVTLLGCDQATASRTSVGELSSLSGNDLTTLGWCIQLLPYAVAVPIEIAFMMWLACMQVGPGAAFAGLSLVLVLAPVQMATSVYAARRRAGARVIGARRLDALSETIVFNTVVKLMNMAGLMMERIKKLCSQELRRMVWTWVAYVYMLLIQIALAPWMASVTREFVCCAAKWAVAICPGGSDSAPLSWHHIFSFPSP